MLTTGADGTARIWDVAMVDIGVAAGGLWAASLLAEYVAHLAVHGRGPRGPEAVGALRASAQI
jgi:hypothetical protein